MIGIISYLPDDSDLRKIRIKNCHKQLSWLHEVFPNESPLVIAQNYHDEDKTSEFNVIYRLYENGIGSHRARNEILESFYNSSDEWLFMMDDDVAVYDYYDINEFLSLVYYNQISLDTDIVLSVEPATTPFKKKNIEKDVGHYFYLQKSSAGECPNLMLFRHSDNRIYFDDSIDLLSDDAIPDDNKFIIDCIASGMKVHQAIFWIKKSFDRTASVIYSNDKKENFEQHSNLKRNLTTYVISQYHVKNLYEFNRYFNKAVPLKIKRGSEYIIPENLIVKDARIKDEKIQRKPLF